MNKMLKNALEKTMADIYVGEYSPDQKHYNICTLNEMFDINRQMMEDGSFSGYIPLCMGTKEKVREELDKIQEKCGRP